MFCVVAIDECSSTYLITFCLNDVQEVPAVMIGYYML